jgi:hypothetical protein
MTYPVALVTSDMGDIRHEDCKIADIESSRLLGRLLIQCNGELL